MNIQLFGIIGILVVAGYFVVSGQIDARVAAEITASSERTRADLSEKQIERLEFALENERERQARLQTDLQAARDLEAKTTEIVQDRDRVRRLTQAKPGLIEIKAQKATTAVWKAIEVESRE